MPGVQDRAEILEVMFRGVELEAGLELGEVAEACVGMTGADLRGLVYTATLAARQRTEQPIRGQINQSEAGEAVSRQRTERPIRGQIDQSEAGETVRVSQGDITQALASTQPSVTRDEVIKYDNIYSRFQSGKPDPRNTEQRATLA